MHYGPSLGPQAEPPGDIDLQPPELGPTFECARQLGHIRAPDVRLPAESIRPVFRHDLVGFEWRQNILWSSCFQFAARITIKLSGALKRVRWRPKAGTNLSDLLGISSLKFSLEPTPKLGQPDA